MHCYVSLPMALVDYENTFDSFKILPINRLIFEFGLTFLYRISINTVPMPYGRCTSPYGILWERPHIVSSQRNSYEGEIFVIVVC